MKHEKHCLGFTIFERKISVKNRLVFINFICERFRPGSSDKPPGMRKEALVERSGTLRGDQSAAKKRTREREKGKRKREEEDRGTK